jgi:hypothetical protein
MATELSLPKGRNTNIGDQRSVEQTSGEESKPKSDPYAWNAENKARIAERIEKKMVRGRFQRHVFEKEWFQHILYYGGSHWIIWDRDRRQWRKKKGPGWWPVPVTNKFAEKMDDNIASLVQEKPKVSWIPATEDPQDIAAAEVCDRVDETIAEETGRERDARTRAAWCVITGNVFVESFYDKSPEHGTAFIQYEECLECGFVGGPKDFVDSEGNCPSCGSDRTQPAKEVIGAICPECGLEGPPEAAYSECLDCAAQIAGEEMEREALAQAGMPVPEEGRPAAPVMGPLHSKQKIGDTVPKGKMSQRIRSPFEIFFDHVSVKEFTPEGGLTWCVTVELMPADEAEEIYRGKLPPGGVGSAAPGHENSQSTLYLESLSTLTNLQDNQQGYYNTSVRGAGSGQNADRVLREVLWELPSESYPEGLWATRINGETGVVVEFGPLPYQDTEGKGFIPIVHVPFKKQPGRAWGKSNASDLIPLQDQRNQSEAMMILSERRMANPVWLLPKSIVDRKPSGEPGEVVWYQHFSAGGQGRPAIPQRVEGITPSDYFRYRLAELDAQMESVAGSFGVAHGEAPPGVTAASALALLGERQNRAVSPQVSNWEIGYERIAWQQMMIFRAFAVDERVRVRKGDNSRWQVEKWSNSNLTGAIDARVEFGSANPKSAAQQRAQIEGLTTMGFINPMDPEQSRKVLQRFGESDMYSHVNLDIQDAQKENERFMRMIKDEEGGELPRVRPLFDNHEVHLEEHIKLGKTDEYRDLEGRDMNGDAQAQGLRMAFEAHINEHVMAIQEAQAQAAEAEAAAQQPPPGGGDNEDPNNPSGPGRPEGTGKTFDRGRRAPEEEESRAVMEPRTAGGL